MSADLLAGIIDFIFERTPPHENIDIGFFGGEPLLEFKLLKYATSLIMSHRSYDPNRVSLSIVTNGTIYSDEIAKFVDEHNIDFCVSCDGPPSIQDQHRQFLDGRGSATVVEGTIKKAVKTIPSFVVNAVYAPSTLASLPKSVDHLTSLGVKRIFLSADYTALWSKTDIDSLELIFGSVAEKYIEYYRRGTPHFINIIDNKITVILRGGYQPVERCTMGKGELAFAPSGNIYPCERLVGSDDGTTHCIGSVGTGLHPGRLDCNKKQGGEVNSECMKCGIRDYCMNWCGCSNYFSSGYYNRVSSFLCASEQTAIKVSFRVFEKLEKEMGGLFMEHLYGRSYAHVFAKS